MLTEGHSAQDFTQAAASKKKGSILAWSFGFLFVAVFGWRFRCSLGYCFGLCFCVVEGLAPGLVLAWSFQFLLVTILVVIFCIG